MIEINLVPDIKKELLRANKLRNIVVSSSIFGGLAAVALVVVLGVIIGGQMATSKFQNDAIKSENEKLAKVEDLSKMLTIQNQLSSIPTLNDGKPVTSRILGLLGVIGNASGNNVEVTTLNLDIDTNRLIIEGQTSAGYPGIEAFVKTIDNAQITYVQRGDIEDTESDTKDEESDVDKKTVGERLSTPLIVEESEIADVSYGKSHEGVDSANFSLTIVIAHEFFDFKNEDIQIRIKNGGNVTDSYLGIPRSIFADPIQNNKKGEE